MTSPSQPSNLSGSGGRPQGTPGPAVLFVCLGNICRSPLAEGVLAHLLAEAGLGDRVSVDSAGTGAWHVGDPPDPRSVEVAHRFGVRLRGTGRQVRVGDFRRFTHVVAMDRENLRNLERMREGAGEGPRPRLLRDWDPEGGEGAEVPDPYYGGPDGFVTVFRMVERSCRGILDELRASLGG
jgi:protein-tyrosine phosphatase